jgi:hypothetical protein
MRWVYVFRQVPARELGTRYKPNPEGSSTVARHTEGRPASPATGGLGMPWCGFTPRDSVVDSARNARLKWEEFDDSCSL